MGFLAFFVIMFGMFLLTEGIDAVTWNDSYVNYHFSEDIGEEDIVFDYLYRRISKRLYLQKYCQSLGKKVER